MWNPEPSIPPTYREASDEHQFIEAIWDTSKEMAEQLRVPLNISIHTYTLPRQWKDLIICPTYKKSDKRNPTVSLTSVICKTLERLIIDQLIEHIKVNHMKCEQQHGFTAGKSTSTNLFEALNVWTEALMNGIPNDVMYLYRRQKKSVNGKQSEWCSVISSVPQGSVL